MIQKCPYCDSLDDDLRMSQLFNRQQAPVCTCCLEAWREFVPADLAELKQQSLEIRAKRAERRAGQ